jgi:hypothetical protein
MDGSSNHQHMNVFNPHENVVMKPAVEWTHEDVVRFFEMRGEKVFAIPFSLRHHPFFSNFTKEELLF